MGWQLGAILYEINTLPWTYAPPLPGSSPAPGGGAPNEEGEEDATGARGVSGGSTATVLACAVVSAVISVLLTRLALMRAGLWQQKSNDVVGGAFDNEVERVERRHAQRIELPSFSTAAWSFKRAQYQPIP